MVLLPAVSSCHSPVCLEGRENSAFVAVGKNSHAQNITPFTFSDVYLFEFSHNYDAEDWMRGLLNGCLSTDVFVCVHVINNSMCLHDWARRNVTS